SWKLPTIISPAAGFGMAQNFFGGAPTKTRANARRTRSNMAKANRSRFCSRKHVDWLCLLGSEIRESQKTESCGANSRMRPRHSARTLLTGPVAGRASLLARFELFRQ